MEKIKQTGKFLTPTDKKCPQKHSTLLRLYIIYKAWSVSLKWREWKTDWIIQDCGRQKVSIKTQRDNEYKRSETDTARGISADNRTFSGQCAWLPVLVSLAAKGGTHPVFQSQ